MAHAVQLVEAAELVRKQAGQSIVHLVQAQSQLGEFLLYLQHDRKSHYLGVGVER